MMNGTPPEALAEMQRFRREQPGFSPRSDRKEMSREDCIQRLKEALGKPFTPKRFKKLILACGFTIQSSSHKKIYWGTNYVCTFAHGAKRSTYSTSLTDAVIHKMIERLESEALLK